MHVHPDIAALRGDKSAQRRNQAEMFRAAQAWKALPEVHKLEREIARYGAGECLDRCHGLRGFVSDVGRANALARDWIAMTLAAVYNHPLGEVPNMYRCAPGLSNVQLLQSGDASLSLVAYERRNVETAAETVLFTDSQSIELVLSGSASGTTHQVTGNPGISSASKNWSPGDRIELSGPSEARQILSVEGAFLTLRLTRTPRNARPSREIRLSDGALVKSASGDKAASQRVMALAVLGAMEHHPATATMENCALHCGDDLEVRWEAVRQVLALDPRRGMQILNFLSESRSDPLYASACSLRSDLLTAHPDLKSKAA